MIFGDRIRHLKTGKLATVIDVTWIYMRGQPMEIAKVRWENGRIMNINSRHFKNWEVIGEEE